MHFKYPKKEKLCSKKLISKLFENSERISKYPLKLLWTEAELPANVPTQSAISVSKRRFKKAVTRILLKRRIRETFRLSKNDLYNQLTTDNKQIALMIIYQSNEILPYSRIEKSMLFLLEELTKKLSSGPARP